MSSRNKYIYMPRGKQFGFLFTEGTSQATLAKTIAHELGHGYFQLKHPFEMGLKQGDLKDNLMDYAGGTEFNKYQWDIMHDPGIVTGLFQSDESSQFKYPPNSNYEKLYPKFTNLVKNIYEKTKDIPKLLDYFKTYGHMTNQQVYDVLKWSDKSPLTIVIQPMEKKYGYFDSTKNSKAININQYYVEQYEKIEDTKNRDGLLVLIVATLLHESIHWANFVNSFNEYPYEYGEEFEKKSWGKIIYESNMTTIPTSKIPK